MSVNWEEQWALFAPNFEKGKAHIELPTGRFPLLPGAGFGDASHPTTRLMLKMLSSHAPRTSVVDIGTGSGILSIASLHLGAPSAIGIDIDPDALFHALENARLNGFEKRFKVSTLLPSHLPRSLFLMNMILPEQRLVAPSQYNQKALKWITSGILATQKEEYLAQAALWGWHLLSLHQEGEWLGFIFEVAPDQKT